MSTIHPRLKPITSPVNETAGSRQRFWKEVAGGFGHTLGDTATLHGLGVARIRAKAKQGRV